MIRLPCMRLLFLHGLESGPGGSKARFLSSHFTVLCPTLDTTLARGLTDASSAADRITSLVSPVEVARSAVRSFQPDVVVGSSFGGAVLQCLWETNTWSGPSILLASAGYKFLGERSLIPRAIPHAVLVHGVHDEVIPFEHSLRLSQILKSPLLTPDDDHRLRSTLEGPVPLLLTAISLVLNS